MKFTIKLTFSVLATLAVTMHAVADTNQLACRGDTYVVASDEQQTIKRFGGSSGEPFNPILIISICLA